MEVVAADEIAEEMTRKQVTWKDIKITVCHAKNNYWSTTSFTVDMSHIFPFPALVMRDTLDISVGISQHNELHFAVS